MIFGWFIFKVVSCNPVFHPRWFIARLGTGTIIKKWQVKLVVWAQKSPLRNDVAMQVLSTCE
jgi:hypothetical protein